ncbi:MAG: hypothetical protein IPN71_13055 [Fibrobacteres bacterium]|nr:hypothetical protein [Fibrobacterota bacterium]
MLPPQEQAASPVFRSIAAGSDFGLALDSSGKVWAWGGNTNGQTNVPSDLGRVDPDRRRRPLFRGLAVKWPDPGLGWIGDLRIQGLGQCDFDRRQQEFRLRHRPFRRYSPSQRMLRRP